MTYVAVIADIVNSTVVSLGRALGHWLGWHMSLFTFLSAVGLFRQDSTCYLPFPVSRCSVPRCRVIITIIIIIIIIIMMMMMMMVTMIIITIA